MDSFHDFVRLFDSAMDVVLSQSSTPPARPAPPPTPGAPVALLFSPHPDDEVITGALPLRLQREAGARVVNVAVTLGSDPGRREARRVELEGACGRLGWETNILGWTGVTPEAAQREKYQWGGWIDAMAALVKQMQPKWVFYPHQGDWHPTHVGVNRLVEAALATISGDDAPPWRILTEYWHPLSEPNLLVECPPAELSELIAALCCHQGEIARNPYHLSLPAWMIDNVRRGAERVAGPGAAAPKFSFGTLYRVEPNRPPGWPAVVGRSFKLTA